MSAHSHAHGSDKKAAFTGLLVTTVALAVICYAVVLLTNAKFASHTPATTGSATEASH